MDIQKRLEAEHSKPLTAAIVKYIGNDAKRFRELMTIFFKGEYRLTQRAAWPMSYVLTEHPDLIKPYFEKLVKKLTEPGAHPAIPRNILRVFQELEVPEQFRGPVIDVCFANIRNQSVPAAIRAFSITTAANICACYPELKQELLLMLKELDQFPQQPAIRVRVKAALKQLQKGRSV